MKKVNQSAASTTAAKHIRIVAEVVLLSPMQITGIEPGRYSTDTQYVRLGDKKENGIPCTITRKLPVVRALQADVSANNGDGDEAKKFSPTVRVPVMPASTICGKLRNAASKLIEESFVARNQTIKPTTFATMRSGAATASLRRSEQGVRLAVAGAADPFLGLFGGTAFAISSNLITHEAYAYTPDSAPLMRWQPRTLTMVPTYTTTGVIPIVRKNQVYEWQDSEHMIALMGEGELLDYAQDLLEKQSASKARKAADKAAGEVGTGKKEDLRTIAAAEVVTPGTGFVWMFDVTYRNAEQLGLFLMALRQVVNEGQIGGRKAKGCGQFSLKICKAIIADATGATSSEVDVFEPKMDGAKYKIVASGIIGESALAAESWLEEVDAARYEAFASDDAPLQFSKAA